MGLQQDAPFDITHNVGKELVMLPDRGKPLRHALVVAPDDVGHGQRQMRSAVSRRALSKTSSNSSRTIMAVTVAARSQQDRQREAEPTDRAAPEGCAAASWLPQPVAHAALGLDDGGPEFLAQTADMDFDRVAPTSELKA